MYDYYGKEFAEPGLFEISASGSCSDEGYIKIIKMGPQIYIPNAFTPNGDGLNDVLNVVAPDPFRLIQFQIIDRWGGIRYQTAADINWRGLQDEVGVYLYLGKFEDVSTGKISTRSGTINLLR